MAAEKTTMKVNIVAADHPVWHGEATSVTIPASEGGMGSLPVADIERKQIHIGSIFLQQFFLYSIQFLHITAIEYKPVTVHGKFTRAAFPYSRGGSGDEYNLLFHHVIKF